LVTGSLNMADLASLLPPLSQSGVVLLAFLFCIVGLFLKMAFFPLHGWLPNAYTFSPSAASSLIAPLTTKVMIYVMIRIILDVFSPAYAFNTLLIKETIVWLAVIAIVISALFALAQRTVRRMLSYIIITEVGYMVGGFWLANRDGMIGAVLHILNDAVMTFCVFLAAGIIFYKVGSDSFHNLKGLFRKMPFTMSGFVVGGLSIIGIPPTCGFFSKWYLLSGGLEAGQYGFVFALLFSSLVNVILFFRIFEICYYEPFPEPDSKKHLHDQSVAWTEAPLEMVLPLLIVATLLVGLGFYASDIVSQVIIHALPGTP
jgi:multicomponent Na+:H+ antiporter subunit D